MKPIHLAALATLTVTLAAGSAAAQQPPSSDAAAPPAGAGGTVRVHFRATKNKDVARIYMHRTDGTYAFVCASPCTADVPANSELRATLNNNDDEPHDFVVPGGAAEVDIEVRPASVGPLIGGIVMMGSGGAFVLSGLLFVALAEVSESTPTYGTTPSYRERQADEYRTLGYVMMGIGAAAAVAGLVWLTTRSHEPRTMDTPHRRAEVYGRTETLLGDVALAKPRDALHVTPPPFTPLRLSFTF